MPFVTRIPFAFGFSKIKKKFVAPPGQQAYTTAGTYTWVAPAGVTLISVVVVGAGGGGTSNTKGGGGGALIYKNNISVTPGASYTVVVGSGGNASAGGNSSITVSGTSYSAGGGTLSAGGTMGANRDGGGDGGNPGVPSGPAPNYGGGGGAGGYSGNGGVGADDYQNTFPFYYAQNLTKNYSIVKLINLGVPGATTRDLIKDQLPKVLKEKPQYVTILIGINDLHNFINLKEFEENYNKIVSEIREKTGANITLFTIPYLGSNKIVFFPYNVVLDLKTREYNNSIKGICVTKNFKCIDLYKASVSDTFIKDSTNYSIDNFHPSSKGYKIFAEYQDVSSN